MNISIITPMYNSGDYIGRMIRAIENLNYPKDMLEIIVLDNGSEDDSVEIVRSSNIYCSIMKGASISKMRNTGASMASGDVLGFVDSDCLVSPDWAVIASECISEKDDVGIIGGYYGLGDSPGWVEKTWFDLKKGIKGEVSFVSAGNMVIKASVFKQVNGFDESLETCEDWDLCQRIKSMGYKVVNQPLLKVSHLGNYKGLVGVIKKERWYGRGMFSVLGGHYITNILLASMAFIFFCVSAIVLLFIGNYDLALISLLFILILIIFISYYFTKNVKQKRILTLLKCMPISFCYISGRALSILDMAKDKLF